MGTDFILQHFGNHTQMINPRLSGVAPHFAGAQYPYGYVPDHPGEAWILRLLCKPG